MTSQNTPAGNSIRCLQTMLRTIARVEPGLVCVVPDGIYAERTAKAVAAFQRSHALPVTGITDQRTWDAISAAYDNARIDTDRAAPIQITLSPGQVLRRGEADHRIYLVQTMLTVLSMLAQEIPAPDHTGVLDGKTQRAVLAFQLQSGLRPTGEVDKRTWKTLTLQFAAASDALSRRTRKADSSGSGIRN